MGNNRPNVLFVMTDQQRADTIRALGNDDIYTPNFDRLVESGVSFTNAYSQAPVCVPARYNIRTGRGPPVINYYLNGGPGPENETIEERAGPYLARAMRNRGYRTFGVGKFHTQPRFEDLGYDVHLHSEETYGTAEVRQERDDYGAFLAEEYPEYDFLEQPHGERTEMYYMPQMSPLPAEVTVENWAVTRAIEQIRAIDDQPFFGLVSFIGPHPPLAPPIPFNRMYNPDEMSSPIRGDPEIDHMDEQIPWMNYLIWATDGDQPVSDLRARTVLARYYGEISYIDQCLGRILDTLDDEGKRENTLVCFFSDHGEQLGDHRAWQKESFFEQSTNVPMIVSWPGELPAGERRDDLVCLTDLFSIATHAAGDVAPRDGIDLIDVIRGNSNGRDRLFGYHGIPGTRDFTMMVREGDWKYIWITNGGREQLFNLADDPDELEQRVSEDASVAERLRTAAVDELRRQGLDEAIDDGEPASVPYEKRERKRIHQMARWKGVEGFPEEPGTVLEGWSLDGADEFSSGR